MIVNCKCGKILTTNDIKLETSKLADDVEKIYYTTPCCQEENIVAYHDRITKNLQKSIRKVKNNLDITNNNIILEQLKSRMDKLREKHGTK